MAAHTTRVNNFVLDDLLLEKNRYKLYLAPIPPPKIAFRY